MILADSDGVRYTCTVFRSFVVGPSDHHITFPLPDKNIVSPRTRTPVPAFEEKLVVQAELRTPTFTRYSWVPRTLAASAPSYSMREWTASRGRSPRRAPPSWSTDASAVRRGGSKSRGLEKLTTLQGIEARAFGTARPPTSAKLTNVPPFVALTALCFS